MTSASALIQSAILSGCVVALSLAGTASAQEDPAAEATVLAEEGVEMVGEPLEESVYEEPAYPDELTEIAPVEPEFRRLVRPLQSLADVPGTLLVASSRQKPGLGDTNDRYRLFALQGGTLTQVRHPDEDLGPSAAALSADGQRVLAVAGSRAIYVVDLAGAAPPRQLLGRLEALSPGQTDAYMGVAWSGDERTALVARPRPHGITALSVVDGHAAPTSYLGMQVSLAPDGQQLAFTYLAPGSSAAATYVAPTNGQAPPQKLTPGDTYEIMPAWQPDGRSIAYLAKGDVWEIRTWDLGSQKETVIGRAPSAEINISSFALAPDGEWVAYTLQDERTLHRGVRVASTIDPTVALDLPQAGKWNDRVMGWAGVPTSASGDSEGRVN